MVRARVCVRLCLRVFFERGGGACDFVCQVCVHARVCVCVCVCCVCLCVCVVYVCACVYVCVRCVLQVARGSPYLVHIAAVQLPESPVHLHRQRVRARQGVWILPTVASLQILPTVTVPCLNSPNGSLTPNSPCPDSPNCSCGLKLDSPNSNSS